jgi:hypothetical protein
MSDSSMGVRKYGGSSSGVGKQAPTPQTMDKPAEATIFHPAKKTPLNTPDNKNAQEKSRQASGDGNCCDHWLCYCCVSDGNGGGGSGGGSCDCDCDCDCDGC